MIAGQAEGVGGGQIEQVGDAWLAVRQPVQRSCKGAVQQVLALDTLDAAVLPESLIVQKQHDVRLEELRVDQRLASS